MSEKTNSDKDLKNQINVMRDSVENENKSKDKTIKKSEEVSIEVVDRNESMDTKDNKNENKDKSTEKKKHLIQTSLSTKQPTVAQTINSSINTRSSAQTLSSEECMNILDKYVAENHWDLGLEYNLNAFSAVLWSLVVTFFVNFQISDKCRDERFAIMSTALLMSAITSIEILLVFIVWYSTIPFYYVRRSKVCFAVLLIHTMVGSLNLLIAIIFFGSNTCHLIGKLDSTLHHNIPVYYDVKTLAILHSIVSFNVFVCAMLLAVKRNDFKFYVLWRKGLLNQYLMLDDD